jgi:Mg2+-importing ATPase
VFGPVSSIFDFGIFYVLLVILNAGHAEFRTGWFVESLATQTLVVFVIRTRRVPFFHSRPSAAMLITPTAMAALGAIVTFTPLAPALGFSALPVAFFLILVAMVIAYLVLVEVTKSRFYAREKGRSVRPKTSHEERLRRRIRRRTGRFIRHEIAHLR